MKILEAAAYSSWKDSAYQQRLPEQTISASELAADIFAEAEQREQPFLYQTPEGWKRKWLPSGRFRLMMLPLNAAALPCDPKGPNLVLKKIHAREEKPIIVDYNRNRVGATMNGYTPEVIVIDGKHRFKAAALRGETHIMAWVGERVVETIHGFGSGGGPAPERTTPAPGASLVAKKKVKAQAYQDANLKSRQGTTYSAGGMATTSEKALHLPMKAKGAKLKELDVDKIHGEFQAACAKGYKPRMNAVHPPGCEDAVQGLKKKFGDSASTYKIAWYMKDKGHCG
jgi:hypothetical protein